MKTAVNYLEESLKLRKDGGDMYQFCWVKSVTDRHVGDYPYAIEFEVINKSTQSSTSVKIESTDRIIWGHPGLGKTFLRKSQDNIIDFDSDYKSKINKKHNLEEGYKARNAWRKTHEAQWDQTVRELWQEAKKDAIKTGKRLLASDMILLREFANDFDKVITMSDDTFIERSKQRDDYKEGDTESWKNKINDEISKIPSDKVITTDKYLSDLLSTQPSTQQQAPVNKTKEIPDGQSGEPVNKKVEDRLISQKKKC